MDSNEHRIIGKLETAWLLSKLADPKIRLGQLLESVENLGWDLLPQRVCAPRLLWMGDDVFEAALDQWNRLSSEERTKRTVGT